LIYLVAHEGESPSNEEGFCSWKQLLNHDFFIHKYTCMYVNHNKARFSPHKAIRTANQAKNVHDQLFWKSQYLWQGWFLFE
jgi:hypothetical protein